MVKYSSWQVKTRVVEALMVWSDSFRYSVRSSVLIFFKSYCADSWRSLLNKKQSLELNARSKPKEHIQKKLDQE